MGFYLALVVGALAIAGLGLGVERAFIRPMVGRPVFVVAIITIGIDIAVRVVANGFIGLGARPIGDPWGLSRFTLGGLSMQWRHVAMMVTAALVLSVLFWFYRFTRHGLAMRATAFDQEAALTQGVSVGSVFAMSWAMAAGLAALAGALLATGAGVDQQLWIVDPGRPARDHPRRSRLPRGRRHRWPGRRRRGVPRRPLPGRVRPLARQQLRSRSRRTC